MPQQEDVKLVVEKIRAAQAQGDQCMGQLFNKPVAEWRAIFNEASRELGIPVIEVGPLLDPKDIRTYAEKMFDAFRAGVLLPVIVLADASRNNKMDPEVGMSLAQYFERLAKHYPKAIYIQAVPEGACATSVNLYCMNPKTPHRPGDPIRPV